MAYEQSTDVARFGCTATEVDLSTDADVVVTASPAQLLGFTVTTALSAHAAIIKDGSTAVINLPASMAVQNVPCYGTKFSSNITVESNNDGTGKIVVFWRAL